MKNAFARNALGIAVALSWAAAGVPAAAQAPMQPASPAPTPYLTDSRGVAATSGSGLCWHAGVGAAPVSTPECDPDYVRPVAQPVAPAPAPMQEPVPVPVAVAQPVTPVPPPAVVEHVTLDVDALFDLGAATLRPEGRLALDDFAARVRDIEPEMIMAVGHTDRLGADDYNQRLSSQRAEAVKGYLVGSGIEPDRVRALGKGESEPLTKSGECEGPVSAKVIACLQADRRVQVDVMGTRIK